MDILTLIILIGLIGLGVYVCCFALVGILAIIGGIFEIIGGIFEIIGNVTDAIVSNIKKIKFFAKVRK